jgi:hypothetical protein
MAVGSMTSGRPDRLPLVRRLQTETMTMTMTESRMDLGALVLVTMTEPMAPAEPMEPVAQVGRVCRVMTKTAGWIGMDSVA